MPKKLGACILLASGALGLSWITQARAGHTHIVSCPKLLVLGSRGSGTPGESSGWGQGLGLPGLELVQSLQGWLVAKNVKFAYNPYPAVGIIPSLKLIAQTLGTSLLNLEADVRVIRQALNGFGALVRSKNIGAYHDSVLDGEADLRGQLKQFAASTCAGQTRLVLTGYSQGAQVTGDVYQSLPARQKSSVLAVVLFGDPHYNPNDSSDRFGLNTTVKNRWTHNQGLLGHQAAFNSSAVLSFCHRSDPICQGLGQILHGFGQHKNYQSVGEPELAASYIVKQLMGMRIHQPDKWPFGRHDRLPFWAADAVAFTPDWDSCNKHWCLLAEGMGDGTYWVWAVRVDVDPTQIGTAYMLAAVRDPNKPPARKVLAKARMKAESDSDCSAGGGWDCPTYRFSQTDMNQLLSK